MSGVKGRSGGARKGAGRKPNKADVAPNADSLAFLLGVQNDESVPIAQRVRAAIAAAQYQHPKATGKKQPEKGSGGRFKSATPPKLVVNNR